MDMGIMDMVRGIQVMGMGMVMEIALDIMNMKQSLASFRD